MSGTPSRRDFFRLVGGGVIAGAAISAGAAAAEPWNAGALVHLIPTVSHDRLRIKASFRDPFAAPPRLALEGGTVRGQRTDSDGRFWSFDAAGLEPDHVHVLQILAQDGTALCDPWPLRTFPHPGANPRQLRLVIYTCGGGDEGMIQSDGVPLYISLTERRALIERALSFRPDALIANGDQIYYDERTMLANKPPQVIAAARQLFAEVGQFERTLPIFGTANEPVLKRIGDRQIAHFYGTMLRSTPTFMLGDDHDLFENDEATADLITLPPDPHMMEAARAIQKLYYPEFLADPTRPDNLPGSCGDLDEAFGTLRYGRLFEALLYDTKRYVGIQGADGMMAPPTVEAWLAARTAATDTRHLVHMPSTPIGWSAGKWGEWYPDMLGTGGMLTDSIVKPYWPSGWWAQHQRILAMLGAQNERIPLILSGDLHMFSAAKIRRSGDLDFSENPIHTLVTGPIGTGAPVFPSAARGVLPAPPVRMELDQYVSPLEKNGFTILDITPEVVEASFFAWRPPETISAIPTLAPTHRFTIN